MSSPLGPPAHNRLPRRRPTWRAPLPWAVALAATVSLSVAARAQPLAEEPDAPLVTEEPDAGLAVRESPNPVAPADEVAVGEAPDDAVLGAGEAPPRNEAAAALPPLTGTWTLEVDRDGRGFAPHVEGSRAILYRRGTRLVGEELVGPKRVAGFDGDLDDREIRGTYSDGERSVWVESPYVATVEDRGATVVVTLLTAQKSGPLRIRLRRVDPLAPPASAEIGPD